MKTCTVFWLLMVCIGSVLSDQGPLLPAPCSMVDIECLSKSTTSFLEKTYNGNPDYGFVPIDPLTIASADVDFGDSVGIIYKYTNLVVTGLRHQTVSDFKMDTAAKSVVLTTKADLNITGDVVVEFPKKSKTFAGSVTAKGNVFGTATYNYELKDNDQGVKHFEVGPETITCQVASLPEAQANEELAQALWQYPDFKNLSQQKIEELRSKSFCDIVQEAYKSVIHNLRTVAKLLPASAFFKDV